MENFQNFFIDLLTPLFHGLMVVFSSIFDWLFGALNIVNYVKIVSKYSKNMNFTGIILIVLTFLVLIALYALIAYAIYRLVKRLIKYRKDVKNQDDLMEEVELLRSKVVRYESDNTKFTEMLEEDESGNVLQDGESRFKRLTDVDKAMENLKLPQPNNNITLEELCIMFRNYSASELKLYYPEKIIRLFIAALASNRLIILQGISGTGKTSLAYAFGKFLNNDACISPVQPSWRDRSEVFGYFNEFTKRFNETDLLVSMYEAGYKDRVFIGVLDEMNISRVEYYFAEMLSLLEMPKEEHRILSVVPSGWDNDPKNIKDGKLKIPNNMWFIGTINNDDSTFMITDKVYDRAMPINIDEKADKFDAPKTSTLELSYKHLSDLFINAKEEHKVKDELLEKLTLADKYIIEHFRIAFGNRIVKQLTEFVPAYVACGGDEVEGIDYILANKILRKFDQLNLGIIKNEIDGFIEFLNKTFGQDKMKESIAYLNRLKKMI